ncbi:hypothetical protein GLYMA_01G241900v4 [Glycine max]|uniref:Uncharacterized protein n=3 Tax=Glycine subgen. Soja TaxID=1462606 RepID=A0A0R0LGA5_SOYBN|nr:hypothetical protein GYH30_002506 [Glycine max]KRH77918.1 hypothetical protein GLYMA_01G241900v4 [Glycine max]
MTRSKEWNDLLARLAESPPCRLEVEHNAPFIIDHFSMRKELAKKKQSKLKHYISTPMRILKKAKELYVKGVVDCTGALGVGVASSVQRSKRELSGTVPVAVGNQTLVPMIRNETLTRAVSAGYRYKYNRRKMSYQTEPEVRKMGTIDEDKPCYFEEDDHSKAKLLYLYPRTRPRVVHSRPVPV